MSEQPGRVLDKPEDRAKSDRVGPLRGLLPFLAPHKGLIAGVVLALVAAAGLTLSVPVALRRVIDGFDPSEAALIDQYFLALIGVAAALALATALRFYLVSRLGERVMADLRAAVFSHVAGMSPAFYERLMTAEVLTRLTTDTTVVQGVVGSTASIALRNILLLIGGTVMLLVTSPKLTALTFLIVPLVVVPIAVLGRRVRKLSRLAQDLLAESAATAGETLQAAQTVQAMTHVDRSRAMFTGKVEASYDASLARIRARSYLTAIVIFLVFAGIVGIVWMGARDVMSGAMTAGEMAQFVFYAVFTAGAVGALSEVWGELQRAAGATERLIELLQETNPIEDPADPLPASAQAEGAVAFDHVSFAYGSRAETTVLDDVSFDVAPGQTVALVGPSGAGKTTVLQMLLRFYDPSVGEIRFDGVPIHRMRLDDLRGRVSLVPQEPVIFRRQRAGEHSVRTAGCDRGRGARGCAGRRRGGFHRGAAGWLRHMAGRARRPAVRWTETADRHCAGDPAGCALAAAGRGDLGAGCGIRTCRAAGGGDAVRGAHDAGDRAPVGDSETGRPDHRAGRGQGGRAGHP